MVLFPLMIMVLSYIIHSPGTVCHCLVNWLLFIMLVNFINPYCFCCCCLILSGSIPLVGEVMSAARGATNAFSGATHHVNDAVQSIQTCVLCSSLHCVVLNLFVYFGHL